MLKRSVVQFVYISSFLFSFPFGSFNSISCLFEVIVFTMFFFRLSQFDSWLYRQRQRLWLHNNMTTVMHAAGAQWGNEKYWNLFIASEIICFFSLPLLFHFVQINDCEGFAVCLPISIYYFYSQFGYSLCWLYFSFAFCSFCCGPAKLLVFIVLFCFLFGSRFFIWLR